MNDNSMRINLLQLFLLLTTVIISLPTPVTSWLSWKTMQVDPGDVEEDAALVMAKFCGRRCQDGELVVEPNYCSSPGCFPCDCSKHCSKKGTCCPSVTVDESLQERGAFALGTQEEMDGYFLGIHKRLQCKKISVSPMVGNVLMVASCPEDPSNDEGGREVTEKCENPDEASFQSLTPYVERVSGLTFANIFCAECNGFLPAERDGDSTPQPESDVMTSSHTDASSSTPRQSEMPRVSTDGTTTDTGSELQTDQSVGSGVRRKRSIGEFPPFSPASMSSAASYDGNPSFENDMIQGMTSHHKVLLERVPLLVGCYNYLNLYHIQDAWDFFQEAKKLDECVLLFSTTPDADPLANASLTKCPDTFVHPSLLALVEPVCKKQANLIYTSTCRDLPVTPGLTVTSSKNLFCNMCKTKNPYLLVNTDCDTQASLSRPLLPRTLVDIQWEDHLIAYGLIETMLRLGELPCQEVKEPCFYQQASCAQGKTLRWVEGRFLCVQAISGVGGLVYSLHARFVTLTLTEVSILDFPKIMAAINQSLSLGQSSLDIRFLACSDNNGGERLEVELHGFLTAPLEMSRDKFEYDIVYGLSSIYAEIPAKEEEEEEEEEGEEPSLAVETVELRLVCLGKEVCDKHSNEVLRLGKCRPLRQGMNVSNVTVSPEMNDTNHVDLTGSLTCVSHLFNLYEFGLVDDRLQFVFGQNENMTHSTKWELGVAMSNEQLRVCDYVFFRNDSLAFSGVSEDSAMASDCKIILLSLTISFVVVAANNNIML